MGAGEPVVNGKSSLFKVQDHFGIFLLLDSLYERL
jgi:hypothetical protein